MNLLMRQFTRAGKPERRSTMPGRVLARAGVVPGGARERPD
jgi:hypothetical protein